MDNIHLSGERSSMAGAFAEFCVQIRVVSVSESMWVKESHKWACLIVKRVPRGAAPALYKYMGE